MHTTFLTPSLSRSGGGIFEAERRLAQALEARLDVTLDVVGLRDEHTEEDLSLWAPLDPKVLSVVGPDAFGYAPDLLETLLETDADLVHLHALWMYTSRAALRWARQTGQPHVVSVHGMLDAWALENARWKKRIAGWLYEHASLQEAACLHALNEEEYRSIRDYGLEQPVCVIPNGVDLPDEQAGAAPPWEDRAASDDRVLLFLGRIHSKKGLDELLGAWARLYGGASDGWRLAIVGWDDGGHLAELKQQAATLDLQDDVLFLGPRYGDEKEAAFRHADGFILPSHSEGLPMAVLEAWSYRLPVLMTPQCNLSDGFEAGAAYRIEPTQESIAEGLRTFLHTDQAEQRQVGDQGRALVEAQYTWPQVAASMCEVYRWVLGKGDRPDCVYVD